MILTVLSHITPFAWLSCLIIAITRIKSWAAMSVFLCMIVLSFIPVNGITIAAYLHGYLDDLSLTSLLVSLWILYGLITHSKIVNTQSKPVFIFVGLMGIIFYAFTLIAFTPFNLYGMGYSYSAWVLESITLLLALIYFHRHEYLAMAFCLLITIIALCPTNPWQNLWNTALDPIVALVCLLLSFKTASKIKK